MTQIEIAEVRELREAGCVYLKIDFPGIERREEWARHVEDAMGLVASSDPVEALDGWGLETTRAPLRPSSTEPLIEAEAGLSMLVGNSLEPGEEEEP